MVFLENLISPTCKKNHFCNILNADVCDSDLKNDIMVQLQNIQYTNDMTISDRDVSMLKCGKAAGSDDLCAKYFKFAHDKLHALLSMCFTLLFTHCYLPLSMIETIIVPIVKGECSVFLIFFLLWMKTMHYPNTIRSHLVTIVPIAPFTPKSTSKL